MLTLKAQESAAPPASQSLNAYGMAILALCIFIGMAEGYDAQAMAFAAPMLRSTWNLGFAQIGLLMSASAMGLVAGSFLLSPLCDRIGRRPAVIAGLLVATIGTGAGAFAPDVPWMIATRVLAGFGLALSIPAGLATAFEVAPLRMRTFAVILVLCGYPLGAGAGSAVVSMLVPAYGYSAVFVAGAAMSASVLLACALFLPESPSFLSYQPARAGELQRLTRRLGYPVAAQATAVGSKGGVYERARALFAPARRTATTLFWLMSLGNVALIFFYVGWIPTLFVGPDLDAGAAIRASSLFGVAGAVGALGMGLLLDRVGPVRLLCFAYATSLAATAFLAYYQAFDAFLYAALALAGAVVTGSNFCLTAIVAKYYPSDIRATASGFANGIGRAGAVLTPLAVGLLIGDSSASRASFAIAIVPGTIALIAALLFEITVARRTA